MRLIVITISAVLLFSLIPLERDSFLFNVKTRIFYSFNQMYEIAIQGSSEISVEEERYYTNIFRSSRIDADVRKLIYRETVNIVEENPFFGAGPGSFKKILTIYFGTTKSPHSNFNTMALDYGLIGLVFFMFITLILAKYGYKNISLIEGKQFFILLILFSIDGLIHTNLQDALVLAFLALTGFKISNANHKQLVKVEPRSNDLNVSDCRAKVLSPTLQRWRDRSSPPH